MRKVHLHLQAMDLLYKVKIGRNGMNFLPNSPICYNYAKFQAHLFSFVTLNACLHAIVYYTIRYYSCMHSYGSSCKCWSYTVQTFNSCTSRPNVFQYLVLQTLTGNMLKNKPCICTPIAHVACTSKLRQL